MGMADPGPPIQILLAPNLLSLYLGLRPFSIIHTLVSTLACRKPPDTLSTDTTSGRCGGPPPSASHQPLLSFSSAERHKLMAHW